MTILVDDPMPIGGRYDGYCHLWSDTLNDTELHDFARRLALPRSWLQISHGVEVREFKHFDLSPSKRAQALKLGARYMPMRQWLSEQRARDE